MSVVNDSNFVKIVRVDKTKLSSFIQKFVACKDGYFEVIEDPNSQVKVKVKEIKVRLADAFVGVRIGQDRNKPDYSFWWEKSGRSRLDVTTWVNPDWGATGNGNWEKNFVVGMSYLKNEMGTNGLAESEELFDTLVGGDIGISLQKAK